MFKMKFPKHYWIILLIVSISTIGTAQIVFTPVNDPVYAFLDRMDIIGVIQLDSEVKPFSRACIAAKLLEIENKKSALNPVELSELDWYQSEFVAEMNAIRPKRIRLFSYTDDIFTFRISPIAGYELSATGTHSGYHYIEGARVYGIYSNWFGACLHISAHGEFGENQDPNNQLTPQRGHDPYYFNDGFGYTDIRSQINLGFGWGYISLNKDYAEWGNGYFGNLILSDKAPSFPNIKLMLNPTPWFRFYYTHGWIHSGIIDSSSIQTVTSSLENTGVFRKFIKKYVVANLATFSVTDWLDFSLGNSFIYAGDVRPEMWMPFNFYKYMDRDTGKKSIEDGNGQMYFESVIRYPRNYKFYSTLYLDCLGIRSALKGDYNETWLGFTIGIKRINTLQRNVDITAEYTRVNPWIYEHKLELTNYKHLDYTLGHWIGQNADLFRIQVDYIPLRGLYTTIYFQQMRKGGLMDISYAYQDYEGDQFLYGDNRKDNSIGVNTTYIPIHELYLNFRYRYSKITDEDSTRTPEFMLGNNHSFVFEIVYGLP